MGVGIDADKFHLVKEEDYLQPFRFSRVSKNIMVTKVIKIHFKLPRDLKKAYTKNVYQECPQMNSFSKYK